MNTKAFIVSHGYDFSVATTQPQYMGDCDEIL